MKGEITENNMAREALEIPDFDQKEIGIEDVNHLPPRVSWKSISSNILSVLNIEKGIFYTLIELFFRPGKAIRLHLFKNRNKLLNPVRFLVLSTTVAVFITFQYVDIDSFKEALDMSLENGTKDQHEREMKIIFSRIQEILKQFINLSSFFMVPSGALISWMFFKRKYNIPELAVAHCYLWSMMNCFTIIITPTISWSPMWYYFFAFAIFFYPIFFYAKLFQQGLRGTLKGMIILFISSLVLLLFLTALFVISFTDIDTIIHPNSMEF